VTLGKPLRPASSWLPSGPSLARKHRKICRPQCNAPTNARSPGKGSSDLPQVLGTRDRMKCRKAQCSSARTLFGKDPRDQIWRSTIPMYSNLPRIDASHVPSVTQYLCARRSWRVPAGESPVRVSRSGRSVVSVARARRRRRPRSVHSNLAGCVLSPESVYTAEAEALSIVESNMCGIVRRDAVALPGSETTSCQKGTRRNLGGLGSDRRAPIAPPVRAGKARSRSRR